MMKEQKVTMLGYLGHLSASMRKHPGEPAFALLLVTTIGVIYVWAGARLPNLGSLLPLIVAMILLQTGREQPVHMRAAQKE